MVTITNKTNHAHYLKLYTTSDASMTRKGIEDDIKSSKEEGDDHFLEKKIERIGIASLHMCHVHSSMLMHILFV